MDFKSFKKDYKVDYDPAKPGPGHHCVSELQTLLSGCDKSGDEVIIPEPCYVSYKPSVSLAGGKPVLCYLQENEFRVTADQIEKSITKKTKALVLSYPNNPRALS